MIDVASLVAIDVHVHVEISADGHHSLPDALREGADAYFAAGHRMPTVHEIAAYYRQRHMAAVVFTVDAESATSHPAISNEEIAAAAAEHADVLIPFASIDPAKGPAGAREARLLAETDATEQAFLDGGWFRSGDVAVADETVITIVDWVKDVYISGGENVDPAEVEKALCDHAAVVEAAVIGVPDPTWGEVGKAYVVLAAGASVAEDELSAHVRTRLAGYKVPRSWLFLDSLPHRASGKVQKSQLRTQTASQDHTATEEAP